MTEPKYSYDTRCWDLAMYFLGDKLDIETARSSEELAQHIQNAVEEWCAAREADRLVQSQPASLYDQLPADVEPVEDSNENVLT